MLVQKTSVSSWACALARPQRPASLLPPNLGTDNSHQAAWSRNKATHKELGYPPSQAVLCKSNSQVPACPWAELAGRLCCTLWEQSGAFSFHLYFNCSARVQVLQRPFQKLSPRIRSISTMRAYTIKRCPKPRGKWGKNQNICIASRRCASQASKLRLVPTSSLYVHLMSQPLPEKCGEKKVWEVGIYFLSQSAQLGWPPQDILHFTTSQAWCFNLNSTGQKVYACPCEWQIPSH